MGLIGEAAFVEGEEHPYGERVENEEIGENGRDVAIPQGREVGVERNIAHFEDLARISRDDREQRDVAARLKTENVRVDQHRHHHRVEHQEKSVYCSLGKQRRLLRGRPHAVDQPVDDEAEEKVHEGSSEDDHILNGLLHVYSSQIFLASSFDGAVSEGVEQVGIAVAFKHRVACGSGGGRSVGRNCNPIAIFSLGCDVDAAQADNDAADEKKDQDDEECKASPKHSAASGYFKVVPIDVLGSRHFFAPHKQRFFLEGDLLRWLGHAAAAKGPAEGVGALGVPIVVSELVETFALCLLELEVHVSRNGRGMHIYLINPLLRLLLLPPQLLD